MDHKLLESMSQMSPKSFSELGCIERVFENTRHQCVAIACRIRMRNSPDRPCLGINPIEYRLVLYDADLERVLGHYDGSSFEINDVAFSPKGDLVAIGTGAYDGGYAFKGELIMWNRQTGTSWRVFSEQREVAKCRFNEDGSLLLAIRPACEDDVEPHEDPFETYDCGVVTDLRPFNELGLSMGQQDPRLARLHRRGLDELSLDYRVLENHPLLANRERRGAVADMQLFEGVLYVCRAGDEFILEGWPVPTSVLGGEVCKDDSVPLIRIPFSRRKVRGPNREPLAPKTHESIEFGYRLFRSQEELFVAVSKSSNSDELEGCSVLYRLKDGTLQLWKKFEVPMAFSIDAHGRMLARNTGCSSDERCSYVILPSGEVQASYGLGAYEAHNHFLSVDGKQELYCLDGLANASHANKELLAIDGQGTKRSLFAGDKQNASLTNSFTLVVDGDFIRAFRRNTKSFGIDRVRRSGEVVWSQRISAEPTAILDLGAERVLLARLDGYVVVLDSRCGELLFDKQVVVDGFQTIVTSLARSSDKLYLGCIDGRVLEADLSLGDAAVT